MSLARLLPFVAVAVLTASCSDDPKPTVSGGAVLRLQTPVCKDTAGAVTPCKERCNDGGTELKIAVESTEKNPDGSTIYKLILDNADGATVKCSISASSFDLTVGSATRGSLLLTGTLDPKSKVTSGTASTTKGTTTSLTVLTPGGNSYRQVTGQPACTVTVNENTGCTMGEGCFKATFACDYVYDRNLGGACGINSSGAASTFVQFANCDVN